MNQETTASLKHKVTRKLPDGGKIVVSIRLNDKCRNGHEDFAITADIYTARGRHEASGCFHDEILEVFPEFAPFVALHLSDWEGSPMFTVANGFFSYREGKLVSLKSHLRATDEQIAHIAAIMPRTADEFSYLLENMGFRRQWRDEAAAATAQLEALIGGKFATESTRRNWEPLSDEAVALITERRANGYYEQEAIAARDAEKKAAEKAKMIADIEKAYAATVAKAEKEKQVKLYFVRRDIPIDNIIYYDHTNKIAFNWHGNGYSSYCKVWSQEEFIDLVNDADYSALPEGVTFQIK